MICSIRRGDVSYIHYLINLINGQAAVNIFHSLAGVLHGKQSFLVDVCGLDGIDLIFEHRDLSGGLFKGVLMGLLSFEGCSGGCSERAVSL